MTKRILTLTLVIIGVTATVGCFASRPENIKAFTKPYQAVVAEDSYILMPPDEVEIHCAKIAEINLQRQIIRPDGKVAFEMLGEFDAAGKTIAQLSEMIRTKALSLYSLTGDQPVDVRVMIYKGQCYYVVGEVRQSGAQVCTGRDRVQHAISIAQPEVTAWKKRVQIVRPNSEDKKKAKVFEVNYEKMIANGDLTKDVLLQPGDIVYVPPTPLAAVSYVIAEFVRPIGLALQPAYTVTMIQGR